MDNELHPNIGGLIFINPGTGPVRDATEENAIQNMEVLCADSPLQGLIWGRHKEADYGDGRFAFVVIWKHIAIEIQMPGWVLDRVRFTDDMSQNCWDYPRLYVEGSSWLWKFAIPQYWDFVDEDEWEYDAKTDELTPKRKGWTG